MEELYRQNIKALRDVQSPLHEKLQQIESNTKFEVFAGGEPHDVNILDLERNALLYVSPKKDLETLKEEMEKYREYPFLYFFGIGNGFLIEELLKNKKFKQIIVIEPDIELIYIALHFIDIEEDLRSRRLVILPSEAVNANTIVELMHSSNAKFYFRVFKLHAGSHYYAAERFDEYQELLRLFLLTIDQVVKTMGNDIGDTLLGLRHHIRNLPRMVENPTYKELLTKKNTELAVIVSTGPSLQKQLPLLKEKQEFVTIVSVDASFPILTQNGIKPDIVVSMERDEPTSKFFIQTPPEHHKDVVFVCASLQHKTVFKAIKNGSTVLVMRPFAYNYYFKLDEFGYVCAGMSSANMAHELTSQMGFKTCAFIGQDLAYGADGNSHSKGHVFGEGQIKDGVNTAANNARYETIKLPAYGGEGTVDSMVYWEIFLRAIERHIEATKEEMLTINSTEGGAHMSGSKEMPFREVLSQYGRSAPKEHIMLTLPDEQKKLKYHKKIESKLDTIVKEAKILQERINESFLIISKECQALENLPLEEAMEVFDTGKTIYLLDEISAVRHYINESDIYTSFLASMLQSILYAQEFVLAEIKVTYVDNPKDNQIKALQWILNHRYWLFSASGSIESIISIIEEERI